MSDPSGNIENLTLDDQIDNEEDHQDQVIGESDEDEDWEELSNPGEKLDSYESALKRKIAMILIQYLLV